MNTSFKTFNPEDNAQDYVIKKVQMTLQLILISTNQIMDYRCLDEYIEDINPAWFDHQIELLTTPFIDIIIPMPEFICKHNSMIDRIEKERNDYLAIMN